MSSKFEFKCQGDHEVSMTISHNEEDSAYCDINISYDGSEHDEIEYSVYGIVELEDIISALTFLHDEAMKKIERETPRECNAMEEYI